MKSISFFCAVILFLITACTVPTANDFQSPNRPLAEDEFIVIWRFSHFPLLHEVIDSSPEHAQAMDAQMDPLFQQLIPRIFSDLKEGKLILQQEEDMADLDEQPVADIATRMKETFDGGWQNLGPYMGAFHVTQRRKEANGGFNGEELELMLIGQDPESGLPEKYLGSVRFADLERLGYTIEVGENSFDLLTYLEQSMPFAYPIHYRTTDMAAGMYTLEQAFATKRVMLEGKWGEIEWLAEQPNLSGKKMKRLSFSELQAYAGVYEFDPVEDEIVIEPVEVTVENNYLHWEWAKQFPFHTNVIFPADDGTFFTINGEYSVRFEEKAPGYLKITVQGQDGKVFQGLRK